MPRFWPPIYIYTKGGAFGGRRFLVMQQEHWSGECIGPKESRPPRFAGLDAGARGLADQTTKDADALLVWYRTMGVEKQREVELFLARRAVAAQWECSDVQAVAVIRDAMRLVALRAAKCGSAGVGIRKSRYLDLRAMAGAWLRAGIMEAVYRYEAARH